MTASRSSISSLDRVCESQPEHVDQVRSVFDHRENYLDKRHVDIRLRAETVTKLVEGKEIVNILDIGCGDGSISLPLLNHQRNLTLLDISSQMLSAARSHVPEDLASRVRFINEDFMKVPFERKSFDLVICVGVLAHVPSPADVIAKIKAILKPTGTLMLECTDGFHFLGKLNRLRNEMAWMIKPPKYRLNVLSAGSVVKMAEEQGLKPTAEFRYGLPILGAEKLLTPPEIYRGIRKLFGDEAQNRNRWLGNQYIFRMEPA